MRAGKFKCSKEAFIFQLSSDVAGATFMAAGTSSPEFFTNIMGTFVTQTDLGIGTIVGSAVFNIFGVISVCGIFAGRKIPLHWYPITRYLHTVCFMGFYFVKRHLAPVLYLELTPPIFFCRPPPLGPDFT